DRGKGSALPTPTSVEPSSLPGRGNREDVVYSPTRAAPPATRARTLRAPTRRARPVVGRQPRTRSAHRTRALQDAFPARAATFARHRNTTSLVTVRRRPTTRLDARSCPFPRRRGSSFTAAHALRDCRRNASITAEGPNGRRRSLSSPAVRRSRGPFLSAGTRIELVAAP